MTISEVFFLLDGLFVDFDGYYGDQCVDLAQVINKLYGAPRLSGDAKDIWNTYPKENYTRINNAATNLPPEGAIVIWKGNQPNVTGPAGHIAIARKGCTSMLLKTFDQNYPTGSRCHSVDHTYAGVLGWLIKK